jgi:hypothetical protein
MFTSTSASMSFGRSSSFEVNSQFLEIQIIEVGLYFDIETLVSSKFKAGHFKISGVT